MRSSNAAGGRTIALHAMAPAKPAAGMPCNGCGVCCALSPCPLSHLLLGHRSGSCPALSWRAGDARYVCGLVMAPGEHLPRLPRLLQPLAARLARRWIAAGSGCDCDAEMEE